MTDTPFDVADPRNFIRLALVVDDRALPADANEFDEPTLAPPTIETPRELDLDAKVGASEASEAEEAADPASRDAESRGKPLEVPEGAERSTSGRLRTRELVEAFANERIGCAVLAPQKPAEEDRRRVVDLAVTTDILILDWLLRAPDIDAVSGLGSPTTSLDIVKEVVRADEADGGRLRLMCIYTSQDPATVVSELRSALEDVFNADAGPRNRLVVDGPNHVLTTAQLRIRVISKAPPDSSPSVGIVEEELPRVLVQEFLTLAAGGLLPKLALAAVSAVRRHTHRLLLRFDRELDPAFIGQRALTGPYAAEQFALALVGDELTSLLAATHVDRVVHDQQINQRASELMPTVEGDRRLHTKSAKTPASEKVARSEAVRFLTATAAGGDLILASGTQRKIEDYVSVTSLMFDPGGPEEPARTSDERFGTLSSLSRSAAFDARSLPPPVLSMGTILCSDWRGRRKDPAKFEYWMCIQPLCDSVRMENHETRTFPLLPLSYSSDPLKFQLIVDNPQAGARIHLLAPAKRVTDLSMRPFAAGGRGVVRATWAHSPEGWTFHDISGRGYRWLGELRIDQAHRVARTIADMLARPGLDESEYVRQRARGR